MSFAPKDGHENQIQFALERGIGAMISALSTKQLPYPTGSFEMIHCSRCRIDFHENDGILLKELNRLLRSNGYFVYSAPPAYRKDKDFPAIWDKLVNLTTAMCWRLIARKVQTAIWIKENNEPCLLQNAEQKLIDVCDAADDSKPSWNIPLKNCVQVRNSNTDLTSFLQVMSAFQCFLKPEQDRSDSSLLETNECQATEIRNVMDMNAFVGGFAVALNKFPVWVMNVVPASMKNTLSGIYDRGLIGTFHDCYPRTYDLLHANYLFSHYKTQGEGCLLEDIMLEMDRLIRPLVITTLISYLHDALHVKSE
ncbi:S-adenosyl-L-methionine-dependent methyltransferase [Sesbania bispinosa]|nr:S-adenosyl-L-methionine-dependent methyltransferase [Sesbania bispinosa]